MYLFYATCPASDNHNKNEISLQADVYFVGELSVFTIEVDHIIPTQNCKVAFSRVQRKFHIKLEQEA